ncbi:hypothetical protein H5410_021471 [Solanum commersonii]|uniref:Uncharacterized protein n=1 Tax=Solanum commersonii TaxID=4109 RepID=A0A9J5ZHA8_SOLCO|nr:hypothetical protein H5410_021471 [Solanum commersonii]
MEDKEEEELAEDEIALITISIMESFRKSRNNRRGRNPGRENECLQITPEEIKRTKLLAAGVMKTALKMNMKKSETYASWWLENQAMSYVTTAMI